MSSLDEKCDWLIACPACGSEDIDLPESSDFCWECQECGTEFDK
jgi:ribosomal protein L37AE/L43A